MVQLKCDCDSNRVKSDQKIISCNVITMVFFTCVLFRVNKTNRKRLFIKNNNVNQLILPLLTNNYFKLNKYENNESICSSLFIYCCT